MEKTVTLEGHDYKLATITADQAEMVQIDGEAYPDRAQRIHQINMRLIAASLNAAVPASYTLDDVKKMPYYQVFIPLQIAANEVNGFEVAKAPAGEAGPGENLAV